MQKYFVALWVLLCMLLTSVFASAAPTQNLLDFLQEEQFDTTDAAVLSHVCTIGRTKNALDVAITLEGLLYDGDTFLIGWRTENLRPLEPALILYTKVTMNGVPIWTNVDHPLSRWYPSMFGLFEAGDPINNLMGRFRIYSPDEYDLHGEAVITAYFTVKRPRKPLVVVDPEIHVPYDDEIGKRDRHAMIAAMLECGITIAEPDQMNVAAWREKGYLVLNRIGWPLNDDGINTGYSALEGADLPDCDEQNVEISFKVHLDKLIEGLGEASLPPIGDISDVVMEYDETEMYEQEEMSAAADVVIGEFWGYIDCKLLRVYFDAERSHEEYAFNKEDYPSDEKNFILLLIDFDTGPRSVESGFESRSYTGWQYMLVREDASAPWIIVNYGYY